MSRRVATMAESVLAYYYDDQYIRHSTPISASHAKRAVRDVQDFFQIIPNPSNTNVNILLQKELLESKADRKIVLMDMTGQVKMEINIEEASTRMDVSSISAGIYLIGIKEDGAMKHIDKLIITK